MDEFTQALRAIVDADDDLDRRPAELGVQVTAESELAAGDVHPSGHPWVVQLDPVLLALPLPRTLLLAAARESLVELALPEDTPDALRDLLYERAGLSLDQATSVVDLAVDLLGDRLGVYESRDAGLASSGHALAHADRVLAGAAMDRPDRLAAAATLTITVFGELVGPHDLAAHLGPLGLAETASLIDAPPNP